MYWKTVGIVLLTSVFAFGCYRFGYSRAQTEGELAMQTFRLEQAQAVIDAQNEVKKVYDQKIQALVASHSAERSQYDERLRQLEQFRGTRRDLETCNSQLSSALGLAVEGERLLNEANGYIESLR